MTGMGKLRGLLGLISEQKTQARHKETRDKTASDEEQKENWKPVYPFILTPFNDYYIWEVIMNLHCRETKAKKRSTDIKCKNDDPSRLRHNSKNPDWEWIPYWCKNKLLDEITRIVKEYHGTDLDEVIYSKSTGSYYVVVYPGYVYQFTSTDYINYINSRDSDFIMSIVKDETKLFKGREDRLVEVREPIEIEGVSTYIGLRDWRYRAKVRMLASHCYPDKGYYILLEMNFEDGEKYRAWQRVNNLAYQSAEFWSKCCGYMGLLNRFFYP